MSLTRRIIDLARSNLNSLLERAAETTDPRRRLASIPDAELEAELGRRRSAKQAEQQIADAKARVDDDGTEAAKKPMADRAERERQARERAERVRAEKAKRDEAARRAASSSGSSGSSGSSASSGRSGAGAGGARRPSQSTGSAKGRDPVLARYYERLEVPYGAEWDAVKSAYRRLMRKYHPDMHSNKSPEARKAATEVAQALTQAYNELEKVLLGGPNRTR